MYPFYKTKEQSLHLVKKKCVCAHHTDARNANGSLASAYACLFRHGRAYARRLEQVTGFRDTVPSSVSQFMCM